MKQRVQGLRYLMVTKVGTTIRYVGRQRAILSQYAQP
jgi:hypothetical protein